MYWKVSEHIDDNDDRWVIYNYFEIVNIKNPAKVWYNGLTREFNYPQEKQLVLKAAAADSEESFEIWYEQHKSL